jgi:hypothetical protein
MHDERTPEQVDAMTTEELEARAALYHRYYVVLPAAVEGMPTEHMQMLVELSRTFSAHLSQAVGHVVAEVATGIEDDQARAAVFATAAMNALMNAVRNTALVLGVKHDDVASFVALHMQAMKDIDTRENFTSPDAQDAPGTRTRESTELSMSVVPVEKRGHITRPTKTLKH